MLLPLLENLNRSLLAETIARNTTENQVVRSRHLVDEANPIHFWQARRLLLFLPHTDAIKWGIS